MSSLFGSAPLSGDAANLTSAIPPHSFSRPIENHNDVYSSNSSKENKELNTYDPIHTNHYNVNHGHTHSSSSFLSSEPQSWGFEQIPPENIQDSDNNPNTDWPGDPDHSNTPDLSFNHNSDGSFHDPVQSSNTSVHESDDPSAEDYNDAIPATKWDLRPREVQNESGHTWVDKDDSGNYDPATRSRKAIATHIKRKRSMGDVREQSREEVDSGADEGLKKTRITSWLSARQQGVSLPVVLKLNSIEGRGLLAAYPDNWPEDPGNNLSPHQPPPQSSANNPSLQTPYNLRGRTSDSTNNNSNNHSLKGHPLGRGCKTCLLTGAPCSLLDPGAPYPCTVCTEDDCECELNVPPIRKQPCEHCRKRRKKCSYAKANSDHSGPCEQCSEESFHCVAGPAFDPLRVRLAADGTPAAQPGAPPMIATARKTRSATKGKNSEGADAVQGGRYARCTACRDAGKRCSLRRNSLALPCRYCDDNGINCTLDPQSVPPTTAATSTTDNATTLTEPPTTSPLAAPQQPTDPRLVALLSHGAALRRRLLSSFPNPTPTPLRLPTTSNSSIQMQEINTRLAHPVKFNCPASTRHKPCHWHLSPAFGLTGFGRPPSESGKVCVVELPTGKGWKEISGGHTCSFLAPASSTTEGGSSGSGGASYSHNASTTKKPTTATTATTATSEHTTTTTPRKGPPLPKLTKQPHPPPAPPKPALVLHPGLAPTRMCHTCTSPLIHILACPSHHLERIFPPPPPGPAGISEWMSAFSALERCEPGSEAHKRLLGRWCAICPGLAEFGCISADVSPPASSPDSSSPSSPSTQSEKCTLRLCSPCTMLFTELCGNDLQDMITALQAGVVEDMQKHWPLGLRADWEFLAGDGFLVRQVLG